MSLELKALNLILKIFKLIFTIIVVRFFFFQSLKRPERLWQNLNESLQLRTSKMIFFYSVLVCAYIGFSTYSRYLIALDGGDLKVAQGFNILASVVIIVTLVSAWALYNTITLVSRNSVIQSSPFSGKKVIVFDNIESITFNKRTKFLTIKSRDTKLRINSLQKGFYDLMLYIQEVVPAKKLNLEEYWANFKEDE